MAIFHLAKNIPPKSVIIGDWLSKQPWAPSSTSEVELVASFHLDDPEGEVGMQVFVVAAGGALLQIPLTYRAAPVAGLEDAFVATMEHTFLGTRYLYDGLGDPRFVTVLAGVAACGYGQALGFAEHDGRWIAVPDEVVVQGTGSTGGRVAVDGFELVPLDETGADDTVRMRNDRLHLDFFRTLRDRQRPRIGLVGTWPGQSVPVPLVEMLVSS